MSAQDIEEDYEEQCQYCRFAYTKVSVENLTYDFRKFYESGLCVNCGLPIRSNKS